MKLAALSVLAALALGACQQPADTSQTARPGNAVSEGRLVLAAVKGNPSAAYFTYTNAAKTPMTIAVVSVAGADKAEMHATQGGKMGALTNLAVAPGETVKFAPGGKHVMVFGLASGVAAEHQAELTLFFADGAKLSAPLKVETAGGAVDMAH